MYLNKFNFSSIRMDMLKLTLSCEFPLKFPSQYYRIGILAHGCKIPLRCPFQILHKNQDYPKSSIVNICSSVSSAETFSEDHPIFSGPMITKYHLCNKDHRDHVITYHPPTPRPAINKIILRQYRESYFGYLPMRTNFFLLEPP